MNLLDSIDDPRTMGLLSLGLRLMSTPGKFGAALGTAGMGALGDIQNAQQAQDRKKQQALQQQMLAMQLDQAKRQQADAEQAKANEQLFRQSIPSPQAQAVNSALAGGGGPTVANAGKIPPVDPFAQQLHQAMQYGQIKPMEYLSAIRKDTTPLKLGEGEKLLAPGTYKELAANPKVPSLPSSLQEYQFAVGQGFKGTYDQWDLARKQAGATNVNVPINMGQKGYDNESKLRNDFKSEPIYKDFQDIQSAHKQIKAGISQGTPIGDVATATKIMKLLDPGSVVRESELGIAMAAGGRMDRMKNYVQMQMSGEKLTPTMRADFGALADELYKAAAQSYNKKRSEYEHMGKRYGLDPSVLGDPGKVESVRKYNPTTGRIE